MKKKKHFLSNREIAAFCDQLSMVISAGIPIYEGISILLDDASDEETRLVLSSINTPLESGSSFHEALVQSGYFPKYVLDMVESGELSGRLDEVLSSLSGYYEREESIQSGIKHAVTYPMLMIAMMFAVLVGDFWLRTCQVRQDPCRRQDAYLREAFVRQDDPEAASCRAGTDSVASARPSSPWHP